MRSVIGTIAEWCAGSKASSAGARRSAQHAIVDTVGCMIAGVDDFSTTTVRTAFRDQIGKTGPATVMGGERSSASIAALIDGTAAHALEYDDNFHGATTHASAVLVPALFAAAESGTASGAQVVTAYLVGLEAQAAVGRGVNPSHYNAGWHSTSTVGCIGATAAVAWMGLDASGIARAMSVAVSMASGVKAQFGTPIKPMHAGLAARNAVEAATLAKAGMSGRSDETVGLATKRHPCCGSTHRVIDSIPDLRKQHGFSARDVERVEALIGLAAARNLPYSAPLDEMQARFSMPYCAALALLQDRLSLRDFTGAAVRRSDLTELLTLTQVRSYSEDAERQATGRLPHQVSITLKSGSSFHMTKQAAKGTISAPFDEADRFDKFVDCAAAIMSGPRAEAAFHELQNLDAMPRLSFLSNGTLSRESSSTKLAQRRSNPV